MRNWLCGKYVVLSGASGGIGRALARLLISRYGASVIGIGRSEEKMRDLCKELGADSARFSYELFDVSDKNEWAAFAARLQAKGISPALLINNAGVFPPLQPALALSTERVEATLQTNFLSCVYAVKALSPLLQGDKKDKPAIVNVSSSAALCPVVGSAAYSASKSALKGYTEALQLEEKGRKYIGIVYPGTTATDLFREDENVRNSAMQKIALSPTKMAKKIAKRILRKKKRSVLGIDAKLMNFLAKIAPVKGPALICRIMKLSKSRAFDNVFTTKE